MEVVGQDRLFEVWLQQNLALAEALASESDILELRRLARHHLLARFLCRTLVREPGGPPRHAQGVDTVIYIPPSYLRAVDSYEVVSVVGPPTIFLPNVRPPLCCLGPIAPGTPIVDLLYRTYEVVSGQNVTPVEWDALNRDACCFVRNHRELLPADTRPLKRLRPRPSSPVAEVSA